MRLSNIKADLSLVFSSVNYQDLLEVINNLPDETDYSLAISIVSSYIAERVKDNATISQYYSKKAFFCEKMLEQYSFQWLIDNGYEPIKVLNKFKTEFNVVIKTTNPKKERTSFFKPTPLAEENIYTQTYKGYKLYQTTNDLPLRAFQENKSRKLLEIKELPDEAYEIYKDLLLKESYDSKSGESLIEYHKRINATVEEVKELAGYQFYNFNKQSGARNYSLMRYITGNKFVSSLVQASEYRTISKSDIKLLKWWLYVNLQEKIVFSQFRSGMFNTKDVEKHLKDIEHKIVNRDMTIKKFGEYLRIKEALTIVKSGIGTKTKFLPDWDAVNCGLVTLANNFRRANSKLLNIANLDVNESAIKDSHTEFQKIAGLDSRELAKRFDTPLLHGSAISTGAKAINISTEELTNKLKGALGDDYIIPNLIASIGREWFTSVSDTIKVGHTEIKAYSKRTKVALEYKGYKYTVIRDTPTLKGLPREHIKENANGIKEAKVNSLYAILVHNVDNLIMRKVYQEVDIWYDKFDCYYTWDYKQLVNTVTEAQEELKDYIYTQVKELAESSKNRKIKAMFSKLPEPDLGVEIKSAEWYILP